MKQLIAALALVAAPALAAEGPLAAVAANSGFHGEILVSTGGKTTFQSRNLPAGSPKAWRWASVTKQVVATLVMQEVGKGTIDLDKPVSTYLPAFRSPNAGTISVRQLLRHQTGLPNPDDTPSGKNGIPAYYAKVDKALQDPLTGYCAGPVKGVAGGNWSYNNCDFIVAGALLEAVTKTSWQTLVAERIAKPLSLASLGAFPAKSPTVKGRVGGKSEPAYRIETFGAAAGLYGTAADLLAFDRALMTGKLLPEAQRAEMWDGQPELGFIALGQWSFGAELKGCPTPVRVVERRGAIGGVEVRNFILPDNDIAIVAFTDRGGFDFGEIWQGKGFSFDLLSAAACTP